MEFPQFPTTSAERKALQEVYRQLALAEAGPITRARKAAFVSGQFSETLLERIREIQEAIMTLQLNISGVPLD